MKSTELRISNLVCHKHLKGNILYDYDTITSVSENGITLKSRPFTSITLDSIKPIPLTEEWLLRLGFEKITKGKLIRYKQNGVTLGCEDDHWTNPAIDVYRGVVYLTCIEHVHTLQNLYFALTQTELEIND